MPTVQGRSDLRGSMTGDMAETIGVGAALRRAREIRGITREEASRDTKLRPDQLEALEEEDFESLGGEVYVRAQLRTYAQYLGLRPEKVVGAYARHADDPEPPVPPSGLGKIERAIAATRIRDNQKFLLIAAAVVLVALIAVGIVSRGGTPTPAIAISSTQSSLAASITDTPSPGRTIDVTIVAADEVEVSAVVDGVPEDSVTLRPGEVVSYSGTEEVVVHASDGGLVDVTVNGKELGAQGTPGEPWSHTWTFGGEDV
jgi:cytoskeletal protein RodZ